MVMYMHVILFFICLNVGMGVTAIPDTPLYIDNAQNAQLQNCFTVSQESMIVYNTGTSTWETLSPHLACPAHVRAHCSAVCAKCEVTHMEYTAHTGLRSRDERLYARQKYRADL